MIAGLYSLMTKVEMLGTSCIMCAHAFRGIPLFHHEGMDAYIQWQDNDCSTRKVTQQCANWLVSPYSHVWAVCRIYGTRQNYSLGKCRRKIDWKDRSRHCICMFLHLTPIVGSLTEYFFKYSSHVLLHFSG